MYDTIVTVRREYIFKRIFHATTFGPVEIGNSFEPHSWKRKWKELPGTLSFIWNPLRVLMHSHYPVAFYRYPFRRSLRERGKQE